MVKVSDVKTALEAVCPNYPILYAGVFGSVARGDNTPYSDVDVFVSFKNGRGGRDKLFFSCDIEDALNIRCDILTSLTSVSKEFRDAFKRDAVILYDAR